MGSSLERPSLTGAMRALGPDTSELLEAVVDNAPFGIYIDHPTDGCVYASDFLLAQFGIDWERFSGFGWARSVVEEDVERMQLSIDQYERTRKPIHVSYRVRRPEGAVRWVHARVHAVVDANGERCGSVGITTDVTDEREFADRLAETQKLEGVGRLSARLAHDLNNLLTVIMGSAQYLGVEIAPNPDHREFLDAIDLACDQARQLTEQLLVLSRSRVSGAMVCELDPSILQLKRLLSGTVGERVEVRIDMGAEGVHVPLDETSLGQILLNLASNGRDAMGGVGMLRITTRTVEDRALITVRDEGDGMDPTTAERAFEPFFTTKPEGRGTGLGLTTIQDLAGVVGGSVQIDSQPGGGTTVHVELPVVSGSAGRVEAGDEGQGQASPSRLLVVEDDEAVRQSIGYSLALAGHSVESAGNLEDARRRVQRLGPFDALVCDILLPDGSGMEFYQELSASGQELPVVFVSGYSGRDAPLLEKLTGPAEFVAKPFRPPSLVQAVARVLVKAQRESTD